MFNKSLIAVLIVIDAGLVGAALYMLVKLAWAFASR